jgi:hypothetical protein
MRQPSNSMWTLGYKGSYINGQAPSRTCSVVLLPDYSVHYVASLHAAKCFITRRQREQIKQS